MHIVVVGGGPAGAVAAATLAGRGHDVTVVEASVDPRRKVGECLSPGANEMLRTLGLFEGMQSAGHLPSLGNRAYWGSARPAERDFLFGTQGEGWHVDRRRFEADLAQVAITAGVVWLAGHRVRAIDAVREGWRLVLDGPDETRALDAGFVVDATGRARLFARRHSPTRVARLPDGEPDRLVGLAGTFSAPDAPVVQAGLRDRFTVVEATDSGWWYSALLGDGSLVAVAMTDADLLPGGDRWSTLLAHADETQKRIAQHGGRLEQRPTTRSAAGSRMERTHGNRWLAVGDAAMAFDPLSSYGMTSAMGTGYYGAHATADALAGDPKALPVYQALLDQTWERYLREHAQRYAMESRWPNAPFWARRSRHSQDSATPAAAQAGPTG